MKNLFDVQKKHFAWQKNAVYNKREFRILRSLISNPVGYLVVAVILIEFVLPPSFSWVREEFFGCKVKTTVINPLGKDFEEYTKCPKPLL
jgi:hypothetical protein